MDASQAPQAPQSMPACWTDPLLTRRHINMPRGNRGRPFACLRLTLDDGTLLEGVRSEAETNDRHVALWPHDPPLRLLPDLVPRARIVSEEAVPDPLVPDTVFERVRPFPPTGGIGEHIRWQIYLPKPRKKHGEPVVLLVGFSTEPAAWDDVRAFVDEDPNLEFHGGGAPSYTSTAEYCVASVDVRDASRTQSVIYRLALRGHHAICPNETSRDIIPDRIDDFVHRWLDKSKKMSPERDATRLDMSWFPEDDELVYVWTDIARYALGKLAHGASSARELARRIGRLEKPLHYYVMDAFCDVLDVRREGIEGELARCIDVAERENKRLRALAARRGAEERRGREARARAVEATSIECALAHAREATRCSQEAAAAAKGERELAAPLGALCGEIDGLRAERDEIDEILRFRLHRTSGFRWKRLDPAFPPPDLTPFEHAELGHLLASRPRPDDPDAQPIWDVCLVPDDIAPLRGLPRLDETSVLRHGEELFKPETLFLVTPAIEPAQNEQLNGLCYVFRFASPDEATRRRCANVFYRYFFNVGFLSKVGGNYNRCNQHRGHGKKLRQFRTDPDLSTHAQREAFFREACHGSNEVLNRLRADGTSFSGGKRPRGRFRCEPVAETSRRGKRRDGHQKMESLIRQAWEARDPRSTTAATRGPGHAE